MVRSVERNIAAAPEAEAEGAGEEDPGGEGSKGGDTEGKGVGAQKQNRRLNLWIE